MTDFICDPRAGGCGMGVHPNNLGFRLVRESGPWEWVRSPVTQLHL
jgi:hypothetical protein